MGSRITKRDFERWREEDERAARRKEHPPWEPETVAGEIADKVIAVIVVLAMIWVLGWLRWNAPIPFGAP